MNKDTLIAVHDVRKEFPVENRPNVIALDGVSLDIEKMNLSVSLDLLVVERLR